MLSEMSFCSHCGKQSEEGARFCAACGAPLAPDAVAAMASENRRRHQEARLILGGLCVVLVAILWFALRPRPEHTQPSAQPAVTATPTRPIPAPPVVTPPSEPAAAAAIPAPSSPPSPAPAASASHANSGPKGSVDVGAVQSAVVQMGHAPRPAAPAGSDRYPGSQPVNVDNANLPDIGIAVAKQVYTTTDSVERVVSYYQQRYPQAALTEVSGQKVLAIEDASGAKVIAIGTTGQETRIAIVQPGN